MRTLLLSLLVAVVVVGAVLLLRSGWRRRLRLPSHRGGARFPGERL